MRSQLIYAFQNWLCCFPLQGSLRTASHGDTSGAPYSYGYRPPSASASFAAGYFAVRDSFVVTPLGAHHVQQADVGSRGSGAGLHRQQQQQHAAPFDYDLRRRGSSGDNIGLPRGRATSGNAMKSSAVYTLPRVDGAGGH
jgi:hypothetical protein